MKNNKNGFTTLEVILVIIIAGLVGCTGWYIWNSKQKTNDKVEVANTSHPAAKKNVTQTSKTEPNLTGYLPIKEWNIKIKLGAADSSAVEYLITDNNTAKLSLKKSVTSDPNCQNLGIAIVRQPGNLNQATKVGEYSYITEGNPFACGNTEADSIRKQYTGDNPSTWTYSKIE